MAYFQWLNEFDVKVETMNDQHKVLIKKMDDLFQATDKGERKREIVLKLDDLAAYTRYHFSEEEKYMVAIRFEDRDRHKIIHEHLLAELDAHVEHFKNKSQTLNDDFFHFLKHWLTSHIKHIDIKYGKFSDELNYSNAV